MSGDSHFISDCHLRVHLSLDLIQMLPYVIGQVACCQILIKEFPILDCSTKLILYKFKVYEVSVALSYTVEII